MARQNKLKRLEIFIKRYINAKSLAIRTDKRKKRKTASRILLNSIPKAGTNLMDSLLQEFPGICPKAGRTLMAWDSMSDKTIQKVLAIKKGFYQLAHLPSDDCLLDALSQSDIKTIFIVRDPRDVVISNFKYVLGIDVTHKSHKYIQSLSDDKERIRACILGKKDIISPIQEVYQRYEKWLELDSCLVVKFEDLVGSRGGSTDELQYNKLQEIASFLNIEMNSAQLQKIAEKMQNPDTPTFRSGKIGGWKKHFDDELIELFNSEMNELTTKYGYL